MKVNILESPFWVPYPGFDPKREHKGIEVTDDDGVEWAKAGLTTIAPRKADGWIWFSDEGRPHTSDILRVLRSVLEHELESGDWKRIQVVIQDGDVECHETALFMGLKVEGLLRAAGPNDEDCIIYGRVI